MEAPTDADGLADFDPQWCLFWAHHVRPAQFAIWEPYLRRSRFRFAVMASADGVPDPVRESIAALPNCLVLEPYADAVGWLRQCRDCQGFA